MNKKLVEAYVAKKVAMRYPEFLIASKVMRKNEYQAFVLGENIKKFDANLLAVAKAVIMNRFGLSDHPKLFTNPTLKQWVSDVTGTYSREDIFDFFSQRSGFPVKKLADETIDGTLLYANFLIDLIEELENATGKQLCDRDNVYDPLRYLWEDTTYADIADFFSVDGSEKIKANKEMAGVC